MGIKNFSKAFNAVRVVKPKDYAGRTLAIDAMTEIYRAALGAKSITTLTDSSGKPTLHISVILSNVLEFHRNNVGQIWIFDHNQNPNDDFHNPAKLGELLKRKKRKDVAASEMKTLKDFQQQAPMFSDDEEDEEKESANQKDKSAELEELEDAELDELIADAKAPSSSNVSDRISSLEKRTFSANTEMINDVKLILTCLGIRYMEAPAGFEGEELASYLTKVGMTDAVYSGDTDPIAYGATILLRRNPRDKKIYEYTQEDILKQIAENSQVEEPDLSDIRKVAIALGTDLSEKTPGIGPKTVLKKLHTLKLTKKQKEVIKEFEKVPDETSLVVHNDGQTPLGPECRKDELITWLVDEKAFNRTRLLAQFDKKAAPPKKTVAKPAAKKTVAKPAAKKTVAKPAVKKPLPPKRVNGKVVKVVPKDEPVPVPVTDDEPSENERSEEESE
jgi:hypothetical protein